MSPPTDLPEVFLNPGELYFGDRAARVRTLLGSCVAITLRHAASGTAGMCHYLLPSRARRASEALDPRFADEALLLLAEKARQRGFRLADCEVKAFGGGLMFAQILRENQEYVGTKNAEAARTLLREHGITPRCLDLGGVGHRAIIFDVPSGDVWVRQSGSAEAAAPEVREKDGESCCGA